MHYTYGVFKGRRKGGGPPVFGFAVIDASRLTQAQRDRYRQVYCGICREIGKVGRRRERIALSNDLVLLALIKADVAGESLQTRRVRCERHPFRRRPILTGRAVRYAAEMNILLSYYHFLDDLADDGTLSSSILSRLFRRDSEKLKKRYPQLAAHMEQCLAAITAAEKRDETDPEVPANAFGALLGAVFVQDPAGETSLPEETRKKLYAFGFLLGKAIYLMDAAADIQADLRKGSYNPFIRSSPDHRTRLLELVLAQCLQAYRALAPQTDREIVENVLLSGIWTAYDRKTAGKRQEKEGRRQT